MDHVRENKHLISQMRNHMQLWGCALRVLCSALLARVSRNDKHLYPHPFSEESSVHHPKGIVTSYLRSCPNHDSSLDPFIVLSPTLMLSQKGIEIRQALVGSQSLQTAT